MTKKILDEFINNVMCRRESNQHKAKKLWEQIKPLMSEENKNMFMTEWRGHYIFTGEHNPNDFSFWVSKYIKPLYQKVEK